MVVAWIVEDKQHPTPSRNKCFDTVRKSSLLLQH
jgi:hypothetical protein